MNVVAQNLLNEINDIQKETFTKKEITDLIKKIYSEKRLPIVESNDIHVDPETYLITIGDKKMIVPNKVFHLLHYLITNKNTNLTRNQIIRDVWGTEICVGDRTVDVHIRKLRSILPKNYIKTNKCFGYRWEE